MRELRLKAGLTMAVLGVVSVLSPVQAGGETRSVTPAKSPGYDVTLVTGDQVHVGAGDTTVIPADRGDGTAHDFETLQSGGDLYVIPTDVSGLVPSRLDPELFNVSGLHAQGYGDSVSVIATYAAKAGAAEIPGTARVRRLDSVGGVALRTDPGDVARLGAALERLGRTGGRTPGSGPLAGVTKLWLDGRARAGLTGAAPPAPAVRKGGYDGHGVTVAVLDTGADAGHAGPGGSRAKSFVGGADAGDDNGHGTRVAAAATGTAPGARLVSGKVLDADGSGTLSAIIGGMEWAAGEEHAAVVDLSFTRTDPGGLLTKAANTLTGRYGSLFVGDTGAGGPVSRDAGAAALLRQARPDVRPAELRSLLAGATGPAGGRADVTRAITAPVAAATASLDYGPVSRAHAARRTLTYRNLTDRPVPLDLGVTGRGLRAESPHLTVPAHGTAATGVILDPAAPGRVSGAVTARTAGGPVLRTPVTAEAGAEQYTVRVKAIGRDGRPARGEFNVLDVVDGTQGNARRVLPGDPSLPCTDARFDGSSCVRVAPGTYSVIGVVNTMPSWADGTAAGTPLNVSFVGHPEMKITKDTEIVFDARQAKEVRIETPDHPTKRNLGALQRLMWSRTPAKGAAVNQGFLFYRGTHLEERAFLQPSARVRTGAFEAYTRWTLDAPAITMRATGIPLDPEYYNPALFSGVSSQFPQLDGTARLPVADAGLGRVSDLSGRDLRGRLALIRRSDDIPVAEQSNNAAAAGARMVAIYNDGPGLNTETGGSGVMLKVPTVRLSHEQGLALLARRPRTVTATGILRSPYVYELLLPETGRVPEDLRYVARTRDLARMDTGYHSQLSDSMTMSAAWFGRRPWEQNPMSVSVPVRGGPRSRVEYLSADPDTVWGAWVASPEVRYNNAFPHDQTPSVLLDSAERRSYGPGEHVRKSWFEGPADAIPNPFVPASRTGDRMGVILDGFADAEGDYGTVYSDPGGFGTAMRVYQGDRLIGQTSNTPSVNIAALPAADTVYRVEFDFDDHAPWARLSTRTRTAWTFHSALPPDGEKAVLPMLIVDHDANLDLENRTRSGELTLRPRHQTGAPQTPIKSLSLQVSYDDGATWTDEALRKATTGYVAKPRGRGLVSLRIQAEDTAGNKLSEEVIRAYEVR